MGFGYTERGFVMPWYKTVTASGNPVKLEAAKRLRQLTIYGNAVQNGTPSPDAPVEVQLCGDRTGNILALQDASMNVYGVDITIKDGIITLNGAFDPSDKPLHFWLKITNGFEFYTATPSNTNKWYKESFLPKGNYTIKKHHISGSCNKNLPNLTLPNLRYGNSSGNYIYEQDLNTDNGIQVYNDDMCYIALYIGLTGNSNIVYDNYKMCVMINEGSEAQPYEPYGYKVSVRVEGVNLFDVNDKYETWNTAVTDDAGWITVNYDNTEGTSGSWPSLYTKFRDVIEPNTEYTIVTEIEYISGCALYPNTTGSPKSAFNILFSYTQQGTHYMTVTSESDLSDCVTLLRSNYLVEPGNIASAKFRISLIKGSYTADTIPPYEPYQPPQEFAVYLPQQIAKVGDVADTVVVDFEQRTAELVQNGWVKTFYGTENFGSFVTSVGNGFSYTNSSIYSSNHKDVISNMYTTSYGSFDHSVYVDLTRVNFIDNSFQTANEFKEWVADLYAAGDPLICLLRYATPVTTDITAMQDWDAMPQVKGTVTLTLSAEVPPSGAEAVYISSRSPKPKAQTISDVVINEADPEHTEASEPEQADEAAALNIEMITYE